MKKIYNLLLSLLLVAAQPECDENGEPAGCVPPTSTTTTENQPATETATSNGENTNSTSEDTNST